MLYSTKLLPYLAVLFSILHSFAKSTPLQKRGPQCKEVTIPVTITANNAKVIPTQSGLDLLFNIIADGTNLIFSEIIHGTYSITGRYCEPEVHIPGRNTTLQLLAHPATYDREYWSGGGPPGIGVERYSWVSYASKQGYPTLAFDRLGNGNSTHPNSITEVQCPAQAATVHEIIGLARSGVAPFPRAFNKIVFVGCSMGSLVGNYLNVNYPNDVDATILTGFSKDWVTVIPGFTLTAGLLPASMTRPDKYSSLDPGYLQATFQPGVEFLLFYGPAGVYYDRPFIYQDYMNRGTITIGEAITGAFVPPAPNYTGAVFVITGQQDVVFCGSLGLQFFGSGDCGRGPANKLAQTKSIYPNAHYAWYALANSGHCWEHQYSAKEGFKASHDWLSLRGF